MTQSDLPVQHSIEPAIAAAVESLPGVPSAIIPVDLIDANPHQPRKVFDQNSLQELAASLKTNGLIQPIVVRAVGDRYELIAGERRLRASKLAELKSIPVILRDVNEATQSELALVENIHRTDLNPIERAEAYRTLIKTLSLTQAALADRLGEDRSSIANYLRLLELSESVRRAVQVGQLSLGHAKVLASVTDILRQQQLAEKTIAGQLSVRALEALRDQLPTAPASPKPAVPNAHLADIEKTLTLQLGMKIQVRSKTKGRGRLVLHYTSLDQFDTLLEKLGVELEK